LAASRPCGFRRSDTRWGGGGEAGWVQGSRR
jgi:hypothetical protein